MYITELVIQGAKVHKWSHLLKLKTCLGIFYHNALT